MSNSSVQLPPGVGAVPPAVGALPPAAAETRLRNELGAMKPSELRRRARALDGISERQLDEAADAENQKLAIVELIVLATLSSTGSMPAAPAAPAAAAASVEMAFCEEDAQMLLVIVQARLSRGPWSHLYAAQYLSSAIPYAM